MSENATKWRVCRIGDHILYARDQTLWGWHADPRPHHQEDAREFRRSAGACKIAPACRQLDKLGVVVQIRGFDADGAWGPFDVDKLPGIHAHFPPELAGKNRHGVIKQLWRPGLRMEREGRINRGAMLIFPWGEIDCDLWMGWPLYDPRCIGDMVEVEYAPFGGEPFGEENRIVTHARAALVDLGAPCIGPGDSLNEAAAKLFVFGCWCVERLIVHPDDEPFVRATWGDASAFSVYADALIERGDDLTGAAMQRAARLAGMVKSQPILGAVGKFLAGM